MTNIKSLTFKRNIFGADIDVLLVDHFGQIIDMYKPWVLIMSFFNQFL